MSKKGATSSGSAAGLRRAKDAAMAAALKKRGQERRTGKCAICYQTVDLSRMSQHYAVHR